MAQWMQCDFIQTTPTWADAACNISPADTHDGIDDETRKRVKERVRDEEKSFKSRRERLREVLERAWDGPQEEAPVAAEVREIAAPYVERLESGAPRIDYAAIECNRAVMAELLAFQGALRQEFERRMELENDDEDVMILAQWI